MNRRLARTLVALLVVVGATWWLWPTGPKPWRVVHWADDPETILFTPDGRTLVAGGQGVTLVPVASDDPPGAGRVLPGSNDLRKPMLPEKFRDASSPPSVSPVLVSPDGLSLLASNHAHPIEPSTEPVLLRVWDAVSGNLRVTITLPHNGSICYADEVTVSFAEHGRLIRSARQTGNSEVIVSSWEAATGNPLPDVVIPRCEMHPDPFLDDGSAIAYYTRSKTRLIISDLRTGLYRAVLDLIHCAGEPGEFFEAMISRDGRFVVSTTTDQSVQFWDAGQNRLTKELPNNPSTPWEPPIQPEEIAPDGRTVLMRGPDGSTQIWDANPGQILSKIPRDPEHPLSRCVYSPDGRTLALVEVPVLDDPPWVRAQRLGSAWLARVGAPNLLKAPGPRLNQPIRVRFVDVKTGRITSPGITPGLQVQQVAFRPDGRALAVHGRVWWPDGAKYQSRSMTTLWDVPTTP